MLAELESLRARVELNEQSWPEQQQELKAQIDALRKAETVQLKRLEKVEALLHAEAARQQPVAKAKGRAAKSDDANAKPTRKKKTGRVELERVDLLEAIHSQTEIEIEQRSKKQQELEVKIQALYEAEVQQLRRLEEAKARLCAQEEALQAKVNEEERLLAKLPNLS